MVDKARMRALGDDIAGHLDAIGKLFNEPVKITLMVRNPAHPNGARDVHMSDDDTELAIAAIRKALATGIEIAPGPNAPGKESV